MYGMHVAESVTWIRGQKLWQQDCEKSGAVPGACRKIYGFRKQYLYVLQSQCSMEN